jgi:P4 family phage/plasmid primase-like protien
MTYIFRDHAPAYWAAGLPVMPLKRWNSNSKGAGKAPILNEWTQYGEYMPSEAVRALWIESYPESNIGLPFGPASGLCAIDIDSEDEAIVETIINALPPSPWRRIGRKGMGLIYRWQGQSNFKLRDSENQSLVEFLGKGNQMVLPPSIHPQTERPYTSDTNLWEVLDKIQPLPLDIERVLREALSGVAGLSIAQTGRSAPLDVVPQGERDIQMVRHAGYLARVVRGIDKNQKFTLAEAIRHMSHWVETFTAHTAGGDDMDPDKGVAKLVEFLLKDVEAGNTLPNGWDAGLSEEQRQHPAIASMIERNEIQRWTYTKARSWLEAQVAIDPDNDDRNLELVEEMIQNIAKDENFSATTFNVLITDIQRIAGKNIKFSKPDLRNAFLGARKGDIEEMQDQHSIAAAVLEELNRGGEMKFYQGSFWQWSGSCFAKVEADDVYVKIAETFKGNALAKRHTDYNAITLCMTKIARSDLASELEDGINFANGFLDSNLVLHDHSPKYGKTFTMPFNYVPERATEAHKWFEYLERSWGDDEDYVDKVAALQEAFAATMFGIATRYQRVFILHGKAGTGKTQALEVLLSMMPPAAQCSVPPALWGERFQLAPMVGKHLNLCGELPEEASIEGRIFKEVVEGTLQNTELKMSQIFQFRPIAAHWFGSNHLPRSRDTSRGFVRRLQFFDFNRVVPTNEKIADFHKVLVAEEREAIAAWAVQGLARLIQNGDYTQPSSHLKRLNQVTRANNSVAAFLQSSDKVREDKGGECNARNVFDCYSDYMKTTARGWVVNYERFLHMLEELGYDYEMGTAVDGTQQHRVKGLKVMGSAALLR